VKLLDTVKVHDVFPADRLRKANDDPLPGQIYDPLPPIQVTGDLEYEVQEILASKVLYRRLLYQVSWVGHDPDLTWYPASNFKYAPQTLQEYHSKYPLAAGPPARLTEWLDVYH
jgi:hypothetical protein